MRERFSPAGAQDAPSTHINPPTTMSQITRYEPFRAMRREFDRLFEDFLPTLAEDGPATAWMPRFDLVEREEDFVAKMDLPGLRPEDINVEMEDGRLVVRGERKQEERSEKENVVRMERVHGSFFRSFTLPRNVKPDEIEAAFTDGVLTLTIPKSEAARPRRIEVRQPQTTEMQLN
jgi:HSP20 family protein